MNEPRPNEQQPANVDSTDETGRKKAPEVKSSKGTASEMKPISELTPEEQMALYEKELKENDWGHQPC